MADAEKETEGKGYKSLEPWEVKMILMDAPRGGDPKAILDDYIKTVSAEEAMTKKVLDEAAASKKVPALTSEESGATLAKEQTKTQEQGDKYRIDEGQTLSEIAQMYKTTAEAIAKHNKIADPNKVKVGKVLDMSPFNP